MKIAIKLFLVVSFFALTSCFNKKKPNYQYFPNMYESVGYEAYAESDAFANGIEAQLPVEGTIHRGWTPYTFENSENGYQQAKKELQSPLVSNEENATKGKELYAIYCAVCHGNKGDGQGILAKREKFLGIPSYIDREITEGSVYHVIMYGRNAMGSHAGQINAKERWQVVQYVMELRKNLEK